MRGELSGARFSNVQRLNHTDVYGRIPQNGKEGSWNSQIFPFILQVFVVLVCSTEHIVTPQSLGIWGKITGDSEENLYVIQVSLGQTQRVGNLGRVYVM